MERSHHFKTIKVYILTLIAIPLISLANTSTKDIIIKDFTFSPATLTIAKDTTVTWINNDSEMHTIVNEDKAFNSEALKTGQSFSYTFKTPGTYTYYCSYHPSMKGKILVNK